MIQLVIKGSNQECEQALADRGIGTAFRFECRTGTGGIYSVDESFCRIVQKWYHENPPMREGFGYPAGTLLFFS